MLSVGPLFFIFFPFLWTYPQVIPDNPFDRHSLPTAFGDSRQCFLLYFQTAFHSLHVPCCTFCLLLTPSPWHMQSTTRQIQSRAFSTEREFHRSAHMKKKKKKKNAVRLGNPNNPVGPQLPWLALAKSLNITPLLSSHAHPKLSSFPFALLCPLC